jgi:hypothetical protein
VPRRRQHAKQHGPSRPGPVRAAPRRAALAVFATLISRLGPALSLGYEKALRRTGEGSAVDLAYELRDSCEVQRLAALDVSDALGYLWPASGN